MVKTTSLTASSTKQQKTVKDEQIASGLGVDVSSLRNARKAILVAYGGLSNLPKKAKVEAVAKRLGITATELVILRGSVNEPNSPEPSRARSLIQSVLAPVARQQISELSQIATHYESAGRRLAPAGINRSKNPDAYTQLFVTSWGNVVHLYYDCKGTRAFRHRGQPDTAVYKVDARDPCCRGRRVCKICEPDQGTGFPALLLRVLVGLHGPMLQDDEWEAHPWNRPLPPGPPYVGVSNRSRVVSPVRTAPKTNTRARNPEDTAALGRAVLHTPSPRKSFVDLRIGDKMTWEGFDGVVANLNVDSLLLALDGGAKMIIPRRGFDAEGKRLSTSGRDSNKL